jgi:hypothetical protein
VLGHPAAARVCRASIGLGRPILICCGAHTPLSRRGITAIYDLKIGYSMIFAKVDTNFAFVL